MPFPLYTSATHVSQVWRWQRGVPTLLTSLGHIPFHLPGHGTLSRGLASSQFPLDRLHLCWLLPFSKTEVLLPIKVRGEGLKMYPHIPEFLWDSLEEDHCLSSLISLSTPLPDPASLLEVCTQTEGGYTATLPAHRQKGWAITLPLSSCIKPTMPGLSWNMSSSRRHRNWLNNASTSKPDRPGGMLGGGHRWSTKLMPLSKRCCPRWAQQRLLSCCPGAFPWWCPSAIYARQQPQLLTRTRVSPLHLSPAPLCLSLSVMACQFQVYLWFWLFNQWYSLYQSFPYQTFPWMVLPC